jgi:hypothetical protein
MNLYVVDPVLVVVASSGRIDGAPWVKVQGLTAHANSFVIGPAVITL